MNTKLNIKAGTTFSYTCQFTGEEIKETFFKVVHQDCPHVSDMYQMESGAIYDMDEVLSLSVVDGNVSVLEIIENCPVEQFNNQYSNDVKQLLNKKDINGLNKLGLMLCMGIIFKIEDVKSGVNKSMWIDFLSKREKFTITKKAI